MTALKEDIHTPLAENFSLDLSPSQLFKKFQLSFILSFNIVAWDPAPLDFTVIFQKVKKDNLAGWKQLL